MKLTRYFEFILEKKSDLLLEARVIYTKSFKDILIEIIESSEGEVQEIAIRLLDIQDRDIDVNTNWIDIDSEKEGFIKFIPETKYREGDWIVVNQDEDYRSLTLKIGSELDEKPEIQEILKKYGWNSQARLAPHNVSNGTVGKVIPISLEDIKKLSPGNDPIWNDRYGKNESVVMFISKSESGDNIDLCLFDNKGLEPLIENINPQDFSVGKFVRRILQKSLGEKVSDKDLEAFVNKWKAIINIKKDTLKRFEVVSGEDIRKYYSGSRYNKQDYSLGGSCMRYDKCQNYLDIYVDNPEVCNLIILKTSDSMKGEEDKIQGRALLWTDSRGKKIMDRIYVSNSPDEQIFIEFARSNGFIWKSKQDNYESTPFVENGVQIKENEIEIYVKRKDYEYWPYMDTFKFFKLRTSISEKSRLTNLKDSFDYILEETDGGNGTCRVCGDEGRIECHYCGGSGICECNQCDGKGEVKCNNCTRGRVDCDECNSTGEFDCNTCDGSGKDPDNRDLDCSDCDGKGTKDCGGCNGSGSINCEECEGTAKKECDDCSGEGERECPECYGNGMIDCGECG